MRVFVTGASGFIGSATVKELISAGHQVLGLARSDSSASAIEAMGAEALRGSLEDLDSLRKGVEMTDGVIHTAFIHDFSKFAENCEIDRRAIGAMGEALGGKPMIITSGTALVSPGQLAMEDTISSLSAAVIPRVASEEAARDMAAKGLKVSAMRFPPTVHGAGDHGFVPALINIAREKGVSAYIGDGSNRWPAVHRLDAARAYRLALEQGAAHPRYHAVGEQGIPGKEIAGMIGKQLGIPVASIAKEEAPAHFTWLAHFFSLDCPASSEQTQRQLGWQPTGQTLMEDLAEGHYFN